MRSDPETRRVKKAVTSEQRATQVRSLLRQRGRLPWLLVLPGLFSACQARTSANVHTSADAQAVSESAFAETDESFSSASSSPFVARPDDIDLFQETALLGARHDAYLKGQQPASCRCLAVAAGAATDPRFAWEGPLPNLDLDTQLVVAFSLKGQPCDADDPRPVAAYKGYEKSGNDIIVLLEAARPGRPRITAAIVPRPVDGGRLLVRPSNNKLPFGQPQEASEGLCEITSIVKRSLSD